MADVRLRRWRLEDAGDVAVMIDDPHLRPWSTMGADLDAWIAREVASDRGPTRAVCLAGDERVVGRVAVRMPEHASQAVSCEAVRESDLPAGELSYWLVPAARGQGIAFAAVSLMVSLVAETTQLRSVVLDIELPNTASERLAERLGAERRSPTRIERDRAGIPRTLAVHVLPIGSGP